MRHKRPEVSEVFTPRNSEVNRRIYIERPNHERELIRALKGSLHCLIFGHSGTGKSWLFKKVLKDLDAIFITTNCANAARLGSITEEIFITVMPSGSKELETLSEEIKGTIGAAFVGGELTSNRYYSVLKKDSLLSALHYMRKMSGSKLCVLILDNFEQIFHNKKIMDELANIIILCDDSRYAKYKIKILIVGTPSGVIDYFLKTENSATIANRLRELSEVSRFSKEQVCELVKIGFIDILKVNIDEKLLKIIQDHVYSATLGVPQRVHEYCEILGHFMEDNNWVAEEQQLIYSNLEWLKCGLRESYGLIESLMNEKETKIGQEESGLFLSRKMRSSLFQL